jgi:hypothetical protein
MRVGRLPFYDLCLLVVPRSCREEQMRFPTKLAIVFGAVAIAAYADLVLDIRTPRSDLSLTRALGASASLLLSGYNEKVAQYRQRYGDQAHVILEASSGKVRVEHDDKVIEQWQIERQFAGLYGMFVVSGRPDRESIFPIARTRENSRGSRTEYRSAAESLRGSAAGERLELCQSRLGARHL